MAHETPAAFCDALRTVDETLYLQSSIADNPAHLVKRTLPRQNDARRPLLPEELHGGGV